MRSEKHWHDVSTKQLISAVSGPPYLAQTPLTLPHASATATSPNMHLPVSIATVLPSILKPLQQLYPIKGNPPINIEAI